ncbi:MAG: FHA domain-containing protein [Gammaproteobacteria bacterium]|nr:FHA domain-containing protein [Gammaproteobacteria bacterium]MCW8987832.1 FHA domain-containing protein [Gammaproteobacteria bacterium]MCW9030667.1 FHA domain-containing protein [Gammaproteobacteria bacterium]
MSKLTLSFKGKVLKVFPVLKGSMTLGSDPGCTLHIDSLAIQPEHAEINTSNNESVIRDLNTDEGTFIGQKKIEGLHTLKNGDVIRIGKHTIAYSFSEDITNESDAITENLPEEEAPIKMVAQGKTQGWLQIMNGSNLGKTMSLNKAMTNLGKPGISTAVITKRHDGYFISQLEGNHPLLIKNEELGDRSLQLADGDTIQIGNIKMQFYLE